MRIGYIRVSTQEQNTIRQEILMERLGVDELYIDRPVGKAQRPELQKMWSMCEGGIPLLSSRSAGLLGTPAICSNW